MPWRIILVGQENRIEAILLPTPPPKRGYDAVSAVADEVWQYHTGGNLTIFDKDNDTMKDQSRMAEVLAAGRLLRLPCTAGGNQAKLNVYRIQNRGRGVEAGHAHGCMTFKHMLSHFRAPNIGSEAVQNGKYHHQPLAARQCLTALGVCHGVTE